MFYCIPVLKSYAHGYFLFFAFIEDQWFNLVSLTQFFICLNIAQYPIINAKITYKPVDISI